MFKMAKSGKSCKEIAKKLNADGLRTITGKRWSRTNVYKILTNEAYSGTLVWGGKMVLLQPEETTSQLELRMPGLPSLTSLLSTIFKNR